MDAPTKTFGLSEPMDLLIKLEFDLTRLRSGRSTKELQFAALDCALSAYHLIEWVLHRVDGAVHLRLTGIPRKVGKDGIPEIRSGDIRGFIARQSDTIGSLVICEQIALTGKHRILTRTPDNQSFDTGHNIEFDPPFDPASGMYMGDIHAVAYVRDVETGNEFPADAIFAAALGQWRDFLKREKLYDWNYDREPPDWDDHGTRDT